MKFCKFCGAKLEGEGGFCTYCGNPVDKSESSDSSDFSEFDKGFTEEPVKPVDNTPSRAIAVLSFIFFWLGIIFMLCYRETRPGRCESAVRGTLGGVCFSFPIVGLILYFAWKNDYPERAKILGTCAIVGFVFGIISSIISFVGTIMLATMA